MEHQIDIVVEVMYLEEQSNPAQDEYTFAYRITIKNTSSMNVQLISRHWIIKDAAGEEQEVRGLGVVGEQPVIAPNEAFEYASGVSLNTPVGTMEGSYQMVDMYGKRFEVPIAPFILAMPRVLH